MSQIAIIGAGISGITTAYVLAEAGHDVTVVDRHRYPAMETSYANGGQLSASNAEVWNSASTVFKALRWLFRRDAPLLVNPSPSWHKYSWMAEFLWAARKHRANTIETVRLAVAARQVLFDMAAREGVSFDLERRGILHICHNRNSFDQGARTSALLAAGGLERRPVTVEEISSIEPALKGKYYGGFFTPSDSSGDIHKFTIGLAAACVKKGVKFVQDTVVEDFEFGIRCFKLLTSPADERERAPFTGRRQQLAFDADTVVVCAGIGSRRIASQLGDRINVYPVKGYSITVGLHDPVSTRSAPRVSLLDEEAKIVSSRLGEDRFRVAGTAELNGYNPDIRSDRIRPLEAWVRSNFPEIDGSKIVPWAGLRPMMPDMMPVVRAGRRPGVFYNTGHGHLGWTLSAATATILMSIINSNARA
jgi:D-amino-acid dehydrogenase